MLSPAAPEAWILPGIPRCTEEFCEHLPDILVLVVLNANVSQGHRGSHPFTLLLRQVCLNYHDERHETVCDGEESLVGQSTSPQKLLDNLLLFLFVKISIAVGFSLLP